MIFNAPNERPPVNETKLIERIPIGLTREVDKFDAMKVDPTKKGNLDEFVIPNPLVITANENAKTIFRAFQKETLKLSDENKPTASMWVRAAEQGKKVALILAGSLFKEIDAEMAEYGCELVRHLINNTCTSIMMYLSDNEYERESKRLEEIIRKAGNKGISMKEIVQRTRFLKSRIYRQALLDDLFESEIINKEKRIIGVSQKPSLVYFCE